MPKAFNSRALTHEKPCINKVFHTPLMHRYLTFHMQDSGQYSTNAEEASRLQLKLSIKQLRKSYADSDIVKNMTEQVTLNDNVSENDLNL